MLPAGCTSKRITATGVMVAVPCKMWGYMLSTTSNESSITLHDHASAASGTIRGFSTAKGGTALGDTVPVMLTRPVDMVLGIYGTIVGAGASVIVYYEIKN